MTSRWPPPPSALATLATAASATLTASVPSQVAAVALFVTPRGGGDDDERLWRPPIDAHFSRRINSERKIRGGAAAAAAANLALLALSEDDRVADQDGRVGRRLLRTGLARSSAASDAEEA